MAVFMFGPFALPLIILSMALLVALVAALYLAKPDRPGEENP
jgi:NADH:ubiquinone oxidoreductase subunit 6 (subunit J)